MAIKSVEERLRETIAEKDNQLAEALARAARAELDAELWHRRYLQLLRSWPAFTAAGIGVVMGYLTGRFF